MVALAMAFLRNQRCGYGLPEEGPPDVGVSLDNERTSLAE